MALEHLVHQGQRQARHYLVLPLIVTRLVNFRELLLLVVLAEQLEALALLVAER